ncbi:hypothetical protein EUU23_07480 [Sphingorhabdus sp. IMCC26285]|jgi:hypothetical protein|uniref:Uncharacterized protein n=1 Tax=Sphingorhabdus profundilacus TaxID=2509718 RepID=A0A6I4M5U6_9SPHN|nr:hypothetical protein [Sphingorhabdus profundilacus]MVZ97545.1 hypothetical protein [Sphingorhabdus profundilacus]
MARMIVFGSTLWGNHLWTGLSMMSGIIVVISSLADRRRSRRKNIEAVGFMPWTAITVFAVLSTVIAAALAIKGA